MNWGACFPVIFCRNELCILGQPRGEKGKELLSTRKKLSFQIIPHAWGGLEGEGYKRNEIRECVHGGLLVSQDIKV